MERTSTPPDDAPLPPEAAGPRPTRDAPPAVLYRALLETAPDAILVADGAGRVTIANAQAVRLFGRSPIALVGRDLDDLVPGIPWREQLAAGAASGPAGRELVAARADGSGLPVEVRVSAAGEGEPLIMAIVRDISERVHLEDQLRHLADHDPLTGLLNRRRFEEELEREVAMAARHGGGALLMLDLDRLKDVNDNLGHLAGDELIRSVAAALADRVRETDVLARLGGDEFAVLMPKAGKADAGALATGLLASIRDRTVHLAGRRLRATASIGIALLGDGQTTAHELLAAADAAMYRAKDHGGDHWAA